MKASSEGKSGKKAVGGDSADIYTAMLGLAFLVLAATVGVVCLLAQQRFGSIFSITN